MLRVRKLNTALSASPEPGRRRALQSIFAATGGTLAFVATSNALDMDAFINSEVCTERRFCLAGPELLCLEE